MIRVFCLVMLLPVSAFASVDSLLTLATDTLRSEKERIDMLREAVKIDHSSRSMHALGRFFMEGGSLGHVQDAERWLKRAMEKDIDNGDILASLAEYYWRIGRRTTAIEYAQRGVDRDSDNILPLYWAARFEMWEMTRYLNAEREGYLYNDDGSIARPAISLAQFGEESRDKAIGYLTRAITIDGDHWPSIHLLGLVYYEGRKKAEVAGLFEGYVARHPESVMGHFFLGLGYQAQDDMQKAYASYTEGLKRLSPQDQRFMMGVFLMADPDSTAPDLESIRRFWTGRDPLFLTEYNERLLEHCRRVAYADLRFGDPLKGISGWFTDKGQAYIRYGEPVDVVAHPAEVNTGVDQPGYIQDYLAWRAKYGPMSHDYNHRRELWHYDGFTLIFENPDMRDFWQFRVGWLDSEVNPLGLSDFIRLKPDHFKDPYWLRRYDAPVQVAQFREKADTSRVEVYYGLPVDELKVSGDTGLRDVKVNQGLFLFDAQWDTLRREITRVAKMPFMKYDALKAGYLLAGDWLKLAPGRYYVAGEIEDPAVQTLGTFRDTVDVRHFGYDSLEVSDLLMARRVIEREDRPMGRNRFMVLSNPLLQYENNSQVAVYFEIYNLIRDTFGSTHYELTFQVRSLSDAEDSEQAQWATAVSYEQRGNRDWEPVYLSLDLGTLMPGSKALRVVVKDMQNGQETIALAQFRVMW